MLFTVQPGLERLQPRGPFFCMLQLFYIMAGVSVSSILPAVMMLPARP